VYKLYRGYSTGSIVYSTREASPKIYIASNTYLLTVRRLELLKEVTQIVKRNYFLADTLHQVT